MTLPGFLLTVAVILFACILLNKISGKLGIPVLLAFILLGMFFGSDGVVKIPFENYAFAQSICSIALIFIMFYGGFGTRWKHARPVAAQSILLSSLGVAITAGLVGLFCHYLLKMSITESFLIGAVISSTDAASTFFILRSRKLSLRYNSASLLEVESGSNDPFSYMLTVIMLTVIQGTASGGDIAYMLFAQIVYGGALGGVIALLTTLLLKRIKLPAGTDAIFIMAVAILSYAAPTVIGGNGYLSAYIVGIVLGNVEIKNKKTLVPFFDGLTNLMQMLIFFLLGLLSFPSKMLSVALPGLAIALFLTLIARPIAAASILAPFKCKLQQIACVSFAGLRGASSIVFAIMAVTSPAVLQHDVFHIVFFIVLFSILLQGSFLPFVSKKLDMLDPGADVMKTFTDYSDEEPVQFIRFSVGQKHPWHGKMIKEILLPPDTLLVLLIRGEQKIVPSGKTLIETGDTLVLSAKSTGEIEGVNLTEKKVIEHDEYHGKKISEIPNENNALIIMIKRKNQVIIPKGDTLLKSGDILVINRPEA